MVGAPKVAGTERDYPGRVFQQEELSYCEPMDRFIAARETAAEKPPTVQEDGQGKRELKAVRRELKAEAQRLRVERGKERERRRLIDGAWEARRKEHRESLAGLTEVGARERGRRRAALAAQYRADWGQRHKELARRREEDARWREERNRLREREQAAGIVQVITWIAFSLNLTRVCTQRASTDRKTGVCCSRSAVQKWRLRGTEAHGQNRRIFKRQGHARLNALREAQKRLDWPKCD